MKTNNIITRPMGDFHVEQRTRDGMFNATALLRQWNESVERNVNNSFSDGYGYNIGNSPYLKKKILAEFFSNQNTHDYISALMEEEHLNEKECFIATKGKSGGTWMHPLLFFKFAMWLNPKFEVKVIKFVYDQMIKFRNEAGDESLRLATAVGTIVSKQFMPVAMSQIHKGINCVVFGEHEKMMRNKVGEEDKQFELLSLEKKITELINDGFIRDYDSIMNYLRKKWKEKNIPKELT